MRSALFSNALLFLPPLFVAFRFKRHTKPTVRSRIIGFQAHCLAKFVDRSVQLTLANERPSKVEVSCCQVRMKPQRLSELGGCQLATTQTGQNVSQSQMCEGILWVRFDGSTAFRLCILWMKVISIQLDRVD